MARSSIGAAICFCLALGLGLHPPVVTAQEESPAPPSNSQQSTPPPVERRTRPVLPAPLGGFSPGLTAEPEPTEARPNLLTGSIGVNGLYTDNAFTSGSKAVDDYQYSIVPALGFQTFGLRTQWTVNYGGGLTVDQRIPGNNQQTHGATAHVRHDFTRHLSAEARQDYTMTNNPFARIGASELLPTVTGPGQLSPFAVPSPVMRIGSISTANLMYQLSRHSAMGISGSFSLLHFRNDERPVGANGNRIDTTNAAGRAFHLRQISPHHTIGMEFQLQDLRFNGGIARALDQTLYLFDGISFRANMTLSLYAGPEFTHTHNAIIAQPGLAQALLPVVSDAWSVAGGFAYAWRGKRNGLRVSGDRGVSDGGGWSGAVRLNTAGLGVERALSSHWSATLELAYSDGHTIGVPLDLGRVTTEQGLVRFVGRLTRNLSATAQYGRIQQPHAGLFTQTLLKNHNQIQAGLTYQFQKALSK